jgi:hypothetical protein
LIDLRFLTNIKINYFNALQVKHIIGENF